MKLLRSLYDTPELKSLQLGALLGANPVNGGGESLCSCVYQNISEMV